MKAARWISSILDGACRRSRIRIRLEDAEWLECVLNIFRGRRRQWRLFRGETLMGCFITNLHPAGARIRFDYGGEVYYRFVHATREDAGREAQDKRHQLLHLGWSERSYCGA